MGFEPTEHSSNLCPRANALRSDMKEKIICIEWEDAAYNSGYYDKKDTEGNFEPYLTRTVGHLIKKTPKAV